MNALTNLSVPQVLARVTEVREQGRPVPTFNQNPPKALMVDTFQEFSLKSHDAVDQWLAIVGACPADNDGARVNADQREVCAGGGR